MKSFEYFWLKPDASLSNPIKIFHFAVEGPVTTGMVIDPKKIPKHQVAYFEYSPQMEICDVLFQPTLLIENKMKRLWGLYESQMKFKSVQVFANDPEIDVSPLYWSPMLKSVDCMDQETTFYSNGMLENLVGKKIVPVDLRFAIFHIEPIGAIDFDNDVFTILIYFTADDGMICLEIFFRYSVRAIPLVVGTVT